MSTAPVTPVAPATPAAPVAAPVTAENVTVNMTREQIAAAPAAPAPAVEATPAAVPAPTPDNPVVTVDLGGGQYEVKYLTGETFKGTATEVLGKIGQSHVSTKQWAQSEVAKAKAPAPAPVTPPPSVFSTPEEAATAQYVLELQAKGLGFPTVDAYKEALGRIQQNTDQFAGQSLSIQFAAAHPEFNGTPENSDKLLKTVDDLGLTQNFMSNNPTMQLNALRAAHAYALQTKVYEAKPAAQAAAAPVVVAPPPPIPNSGPVDLSTVPDDLKVNVNMSREEISRRIDLARQRNIIY